MDNILSPTSNLFPEDPSADDDIIWFPGICSETRRDPLASPSWSEESSSTRSPGQYSIEANNEDFKNEYLNLKQGKLPPIVWYY